jgi:GNAT superfamily N-acetyltransferase
MVGSAPSSADSIVVRPLDAGEEAEVLRVLQAAFGKWPLGLEDIEPSEFFRWKHMENPFGPSIMVVAKDGDRIVGFGAYLRWRLRARGQTFEALEAVDFAVHPSNRGRGLQIAMTRAATELFEPGIALTFSSPNERSLSGSLKTGRRQLGRLPVYIRPGLGRAPRRAEGTATSEPENDAGSAAEALARGDEIELLLDQAETSGDRLTTARDLSYLRWRYALDQYRAVRCETGGLIAGLAIFRRQRRGSRVVSRVCELLVAGGDRPTARTLLRRVRKAATTDVVTCSFPSRRWALSCGFVPAPRGPLLNVYPRREGLDPDPTRRASWALSIGDLELL